MQNKPNFQKSQMNVSILLQMDYENKRNWTFGESKPNSNPIKANFERGTGALERSIEDVGLFLHHRVRPMSVRRRLGRFHREMEPLPTHLLANRRIGVGRNN